MSDILNQVQVVLEQRRQADPGSSYVASLYHKGLNKILEKVGEEAVETILAARDTEAGGDPAKLVYETADLWFHCMVLLAHQGLHPSDVTRELERRFGLSGLEEKAGRAE